MMRIAWVFVAAICAIGCFDRSRVNEQCEWTPEHLHALDLTDWPQQRHLYDDIDLADELAIRYADGVYRERSGFEGHGGLLENGTLRDRCLSKMLGAIAAAHDLPLDRVVEARTRGYRDPRWDAGVLLSFALLYGILAWAIVHAIGRRFPVEEGWPSVVAPLLASVPVGFAAFQLFALWGGALEAIRLQNGHVSSYRASKSPWPGHDGELWIAAVLTFVVVALLHSWFQHRRSRPFGTGSEAV